MKTRLIYLIGLILFSFAPANAQMKTPETGLPAIERDSKAYNVIALPDTQNYAASYPDIYHSQTQYCASRFAAAELSFVTHLGDIVDEGETIWQWDNARAAMDHLDDAGVPYGTCVGNHDILYPGSYYDPDGLNYLAYFGPGWYQHERWYRGASPSGLSNYQILEVGRRQMLFLHLLVETPAAELAWAQSVLYQHRDLPALVSTHRYLFNWLGVTGRYGDTQYAVEPLYRHDGIKAYDFFHSFVAANKQIFMVYCGHCAGEYQQVSNNHYGLPVIEVLADYQDGYGSGGNGWLRILRFDEREGSVHNQTYSPWLDDWRTGSESDFVHGLNLDDYRTPNPALRFQQGYGGYEGAQDTCIKEADPNTSYGDEAIVTVDDDTEDAWFNEYEGQGLMRFDDMFQGAVLEGDPPPDRIPLGATIHSAILTINLQDDTDWTGNPEFYVYRMLVGWTEASTWSSLGGGIDPGIDCESDWIALFYGDNNPNADYNRSFSVLSAVQAWSDGAPNHGFAILPERIDFNDDGIEIHSSEWGSPPQRPALVVEFSYLEQNVPPDVTATLGSRRTALYEGDVLAISMAAADPNPLDPLVFAINGLNVGYATGEGSVTHEALVEDDGVYVFTGTVADDEAVVPAGELRITAINVAPAIIALTGDLEASAGDSFDFAAEAADPGPWDELAYTWDCDGDGLFDDVAGPAGHWSFASPGDYRVQVEVVDGDGGTAYGAFTVKVR